MKQWTPVRGWEREPEQGLFASLARLLPANSTILEIGSEHGMSASLWSVYAPSSKIYCVEINPNADFLENLENANIDTSHIEWILGSSQEVLIPPDVISNGVDLLFIDGDHSYEGALADLERWAKIVKPNGLMLVHDCACSTNSKIHPLHVPVYTAVQHFLSNSGGWRSAFSVESTMVLVRI